MPNDLPPAPGLRWLERVNGLIARILCVLVSIAIGVLVIPVSLQVFSRFTALIPHYIWTEEMARFLLVWAIMLGAMLCVREGNHFVVDVWPDMRPRARAALDLFANLCVGIFAAVLLWWGWEFTDFAWYRISELAELPLWTIHIAWPVCGAVWLLFLAEGVAANLRTLATGRG
ncbi:TRAP transporter small permease [Elioraea rosea]|uniref:TRAP transporter small permease n=1 Tax=Elioraea rosea TaxID=2492390 RepID=UPI00118620F4|nr:TRAP transporter small permease [Elioraea rosea]